MTTTASEKKPYTPINFRKKIRDRNKIRVIEKLTEEWLLTPNEVCDRLLCEALVREKDRLKL